MPQVSRRNVIRGAAVTGAAAAASVAPAGRAFAESGKILRPSEARQGGDRPRHGDLRDIKHIVVLMQENRSFDHYFGSLAGVIGFGDRSTITLPSGYSVWQQPTTPPTLSIGGTQYPWPLSNGAFAGAQPPNPEQGAQNYGGTSHGWADQHGAWYGGLMDAWYYAKGGPTTLGFLNRADIPFHYALADAYTIGDGYHCSILSATGPNRTFLWSGTINADQAHGTFIANNGGDEIGRFLPWQSYPETLQAAGVTWKVYQGSDNYGDNGAQYFKTFADLDPSQGGTQPAGPNVWFDDGLAVVPEPLDAEFRVPLLLISPWTRGGWVTSEVSDHTSVIQLMEKWTAAIGTPAICPNISAWRRSVCGDLLGAFDFQHPEPGLPDLPFITAPVGEEHSYHPIPNNNAMPVQEPGVKKARALPYQANASLTGFSTAADGTVSASLSLSNNGPHVGRASHFSVYDNTLQVAPGIPAYPAAFPGQYTVAGSRKDRDASTQAAVTVRSKAAYDITVVSANRFLRRFTGDVTKPGAALKVTASYYAHGFDDKPKLILELDNNSGSDVTF